MCLREPTNEWKKSSKPTHLLKQVPSQIFCCFKQIICICLRRDLKKKKVEFFPCEQNRAFGVLYAEGFKPYQEITLFFALQNETRNFPFFSSHCLLRVSIWRTTSGTRAAGAAPCTPQVFHCPPNSFLLLHKAETRPQPEAHRQKTPLAFLVHLLLASLPHGAPQQSPRPACFQKSCCLQSPTLTPSNDLCILSISNICPHSETHTNDSGVSEVASHCWNL